MVPLRLDVPVLVAAVIVNEPLPVRLVGLILDIVNQFTLLLGALQVVLDVTLILVLVADAPGFQFVGVSIKVGVTADVTVTI